MRLFQRLILSSSIGATLLGCGSSRPVNESSHGNAMADRTAVEKHLAAAGMTGEILRLDDRGERWEVAFATPLSKESQSGVEKNGDVVMKSPVQTLSVSKSDGRVSKID